MGTTTRGYPYPEDSDRVDVPGDMQDALEAIDTDVSSLETSADDTAIRALMGVYQ